MTNRVNYLKLSKFDTANGIGIGTVVWVSGCSHRCKGCHNPETWNELAGEPFTSQTLEELLGSISNPHIKRVTLSGGDPLYPANHDSVLNIAKAVKDRYPQKRIWLYTGYLYEEIKELPVMAYVDVLVDGKFELELKDVSLPFSGSSNQRLIDVPKTRERGEIVIFETD